MSNQRYTVLVEVKAHSISFEGRRYVRKDYALIPRHMAVQYGDSVRILSRAEQLQKEKEWKDADSKA